MTNERVAPTQRFTKKTQECPICEGYRELPSGKGERCAGYLSPDGRYAYCTREEYAGKLVDHIETAAGPAWRHWLGAGVCRCGQTHGAGDTREQEQLTPKRTAWELVFASGTLAGVHIRTDYLNGNGQPTQAKQFRWEQHHGRSSRDMPLYNLPELQAAPKGSTVYLTEGEKACDALRRQGVLAVATVTGAGVTPCDESLRPLVGHDARLWPDHDDGGRQHMDRIAARLVALGGSSRTLRWPAAPPKGDAYDYFAGGGTVEGLAGLLKDDSPKRRSGVIIADVQPEIVRWLWLHRIPLGKLTVLDGDPDNGKSLLSLDLAARVTRDDVMPDGTPGISGGVVLCSAEDGLADTIRPRLEAAGADLHRVVALTTVATVNPETGETGEYDLILPRDLVTVEEEARAVGAKLIVIDPLMAFLDTRVDGKSDQNVRAALRPFAAMAERTGAAVLVIRHLVEMAGTNALYRGGGSIGIIGAARSGLLVAPDPNDLDKQRRVLACPKHNLAPTCPALAYRVVEHRPGVPKVEWLGETEYTASELLAAPADDETRSAGDEARQFLQEALCDGARPAKDVQREAREAGISEITLRRARSKVGVSVERQGFGKDGQFMWLLSAPSPDHRCSLDPIDDHHKIVSINGRDDHLWGPPDRDCLLCGERCWIERDGAWKSGCTPEEAS